MPKSVLASVVIVLVLVSCGPSDEGILQGYVEAEFVHVSSPVSGKLQALAVERGQQVEKGKLLFELEQDPDRLSLNEATENLRRVRAELSDASKGLRPSEMEALQANLLQAKAQLLLSESQQKRQEKLFRSAVSTPEEFDQAKQTWESDKYRVQAIEAEIETAKLGQRSDRVEALQAQVAGLNAARERAEWNLSQKRQSAHQNALVFDVLYRPGEFIPGGRPVVVLLPPENIKVRTFVPQSRLATLQVGDKAEIVIDGERTPVPGAIHFISPQAEYTPPVIFSQSNRNKLVFMVEIVVSADFAKQLHPGQPVDVRFES